MKISEFDASKIYSAIVEAGDSWSDKDAAATILEEVKKSVLAELFISQPMTLSATVREWNALADPAYKLHLTNMVLARKEANKARVRFDGAKLLGELRRSEESSRRAAMRAA